MSNITFIFLKTSLNKVTSFIYETPLSIVATGVAGIAFSIFSFNLATPLLALTCAVTLTRMIVKVLEKSDLDLFVQFNEKMDENDSKYRNLYYMAYTATILVSIVLPALGIVLGIGIGTYKGLIVQIQIQKIKQDTREQEVRFNLFSPSSWPAGF
ncbi:putative membrane-associated protein [Waddlia chondrophila 2032/99]|uniref:Putative membrane-associated protein n=2 Tax=Waddlia chondrophila TaxID=71667 RepID=D6YVG6_WADCW|nr:hypothetical protein [Waddlia chondrophila]ADI38127.1 putative membrane-associated protein [Waddlia chondrophila WSU 86-1044]CCB91181.1 putative membrane-associated protein [Waddlia chondrophila 2032/99]